MSDNLAREVFGRALELPDGERSGYVDRACRGDAELASEVRELLVHHAQARGFLEPGASDGPETFESPSPEAGVACGAINQGDLQVARLLEEGATP